MTDLKMSDGKLIHLSTSTSQEAVKELPAGPLAYIYTWKAELDGSLLEGYGATARAAVSDLYKEIRDEKRRNWEAGLE